jgi:hypothetical protein
MEPIIALSAVVIGLLASIFAEFIKRRYGAEKEEGIEDRVQKLTTSLRQATGLISQIESEITKRSELADRLKADVDRYKKLRSLSQPEVEAVAQTLRFELQKEGTKSFWKGVLVNFIFFLLGAAASYGISRFIK